MDDFLSAVTKKKVVLIHRKCFVFIIKCKHMRVHKIIKIHLKINKNNKGLYSFRRTPLLSKKKILLKIF